MPFDALSKMGICLSANGNSWRTDKICDEIQLGDFNARHGIAFCRQSDLPASLVEQHHLHAQNF